MSVNDNVGLTGDELLSRRLGSIDAANFNVSSKSADGALFRVSATQDDGALLRMSSIVPFTYSSITTSAQTAVKSSAGVLHGVAVLANNISSLAFYDNTVSGGTTIFTLPVSAMATSTWWQFDTNFATGLVVSSGSSNTSVVVSYI